MSMYPCLWYKRWLCQTLVVQWAPFLARATLWTRRRQWRPFSSRAVWAPMCTHGIKMFQAFLLFWKVVENCRFPHSPRRTYQMSGSLGKYETFESIISLNLREGKKLRIRTKKFWINRELPVVSRFDMEKIGKEAFDWIAEDDYVDHSVSQFPQRRAELFNPTFRLSHGRSFPFQIILFYHNHRFCSRLHKKKTRLCVRKMNIFYQI